MVRPLLPQPLSTGQELCLPTYDFHRRRARLHACMQIFHRTAPPPATMKAATSGRPPLRSASLVTSPHPALLVLVCLLAALPGCCRAFTYPLWDDAVLYE